VDGNVGTVMIAETDHCCRGFGRMDAWLRERGLQKEGQVGNGGARLCSSRDIVAVAVEQLGRDPLVFLCAAGEGCEECDAARASISAA
ncbi:MAG: AAC(3) family N-acetyltransferase, partial [Byssovorax sp.]